MVAVSSVQGSTDYGQTYTALTQYTEWVLQDSTIVSLDGTGYFPKLIKGYKVTYTAGYNDVPNDLELAILDLITYYRKANSAVHSTRDITPNTTQINYVSSNNLPPHIKRILDLHKADYT